MVQEDIAPSHANSYQKAVFMSFDILRLMWPGNSPDLNMIETCWAWMKQKTQFKGAPRTRATAEKAWKQVWKDLPQKTIQDWIERMPRHLEEVIRLEGRNEYHEGNEGGDLRPSVKKDQPCARRRQWTQTVVNS